MASKRADGFTLIELMIVIAVVGLLATAAVPAYRHYLARSQVSKALSLASELKTRITEIYMIEGALAPADSGSSGLPAPADVTSEHVAQVNVTNGRIEAEFATAASPGLAGNRLRLSPATSAGGISWRCTSPDIEASLLPASCR